MRSVGDIPTKGGCVVLLRLGVKETVGYICESSGAFEFCKLLAAAVIFGGVGACLNAVGAAFTSVNGCSVRRRSDRMGWVRMVVVMGVIGGGWYKR